MLLHRHACTRPRAHALEMDEVITRQSPGSWSSYSASRMFARASFACAVVDDALSPTFRSATRSRCSSAARTRSASSKGARRRPRGGGQAPYRRAGARGGVVELAHKV